MNRAYPKTITPLARVTRKTDRNQRKYLSFRAMTTNQDGTKPREMTVTVHGPNVDRLIGSLKKGVATQVLARFDAFVGADGGRGQTLRLLGLRPQAANDTEGQRAAA